MIVGGVETEVRARRSAQPFGERVEHRQRLLRRRGYPQAAETAPPSGQAALWYAEVIQCVPPSGARVARQLARLAGNDSLVCIPVASLASAVGHRDSAGREVAYTQTGLTALVGAGWLRVEHIGKGAATRTTYYLMPGDPNLDWFPENDKDWEHQRENAWDDEQLK